MWCFTTTCFRGPETPRLVGSPAVERCSNLNGQEIQEACLLPSLLAWLPSFFSFFLSKMLSWIVWHFKYFEYSTLNRFSNQFWKKKEKKKPWDSIHCHSSLPPLTTLPAILVQVRALQSHLLWIHFSNASSGAPMLKLRSITSSALPLSANVVIWSLSNWVSFDMISYLETQAYLQVFYLCMCLYNLYWYFLLDCPLIVLESLGFSHFYLFYK